ACDRHGPRPDGVGCRSRRLHAGHPAAHCRRDPGSCCPTPRQRRALPVGEVRGRDLPFVDGVASAARARTSADQARPHGNDAPGHHPTRLPHQYLQSEAVDLFPGLPATVRAGRYVRAGTHHGMARLRLHGDDLGHLCRLWAGCGLHPRPRAGKPACHDVAAPLLRRCLRLRRPAARIDDTIGSRRKEHTMTFASILLFAGALIVAAGSPGPSIAALVARVLAKGFRDVLPFLAAMWIGEGIWLSFAVFGLAYIAETFHHAFVVIKYAGVAYLAYLAWKMWTAPVAADQSEMPRAGSAWKLFLAGMAV